MAGCVQAGGELDLAGQIGAGDPRRAGRDEHRAAPQDAAGETPLDAAAGPRVVGTGPRLPLHAAEHPRGVIEVDVDVRVDNRRLGDAVRRCLAGDPDVRAVGDDAPRALADDAHVLVARAERVRGIERDVGLARPSEVAQDAALERQDVGAVWLERLGVLYHRIGVVDAPAREERGAQGDTGVDLPGQSRDDVAEERDGVGPPADARQQAAEPDPRVEIVGIGCGERLKRLDGAQRVAGARHPLGILVRHGRPRRRLGVRQDRRQRSRAGVGREQRRAQRREQRRHDHRSSRPRRAMSSCGLNGLIM